MMSPAHNTLSDATSPYLRQHADNPVHWQQWNTAALSEAAHRDVPIVLSVGYAACHWCHVMAHESFEDPDVAAVMNADFLCIKVDREERPDIDAVYMNATVAMTGQGGWPMTCFLTPDGRPFFCGTYYPKSQFLQLLTLVTDIWRTRRDEVEHAGDQLTAELQRPPRGLIDEGPEITAQLCDDAVAKVLRDEDVQHGGFGAAPKFPPSTLLEALLRNYERTWSPLPLATVQRTGEAMARGGMYDHLGGGFARYSVDAHWVVPHFEKMLYDNAQLLRFYAHWARCSANSFAHRIATQTAAFVVNDLSVDDVFASSLDADAAGCEGSTYVWTPQQLIEVLGDDDGHWAAELFAVTKQGNFDHATSVLQLPNDPDDAHRFERIRTTLLAARSVRAQPPRDDKVVTGWNGMAITALAEASVALHDPELLQAAVRCASTLVQRHIVDGRLRRASLGGVVGHNPAMLDDHGALATGLFTLYQMTGDADWLSRGTHIVELALRHCADPDRPGRWYDSADDAEALMVRPADPFDGATGSGAALIAEALLMAAYLVDTDQASRYRQVTEETLRAHSPLLVRVPRSAGQWLAVAEAAVSGPLQVVVSCEDPDSALLAAARQLAPGGAIVVGGQKDSSALLSGRGRVEQADAAYVCRGQVCALPVTNADELVGLVGAPRPRFPRPSQ